MSIVYKYNNILGAYHNCGHLAFSNDGNVLYSANGNRVHLNNLIYKSHYTLPVEVYYNIDFILPKENKHIFVIDIKGYVNLINTEALSIISVIKMPHRVTACSLSQDGCYLCVAYNGEIALWKTSNASNNYTYTKEWELKGHNGRCNHIFFTPDNYILSCGDDMTVRIWSIKKGFTSKAFVDDKQKLLFCYMSNCGNYIIAGGYKGRVVAWKWEVEKNGNTRLIDIRPSKYRKILEEKQKVKLNEYYMNSSKDEGATEDIQIIEEEITVENKPHESIHVADYKWTHGSWSFFAKGKINIENLYITQATYNTRNNLIFFSTNTGVLIVCKLDFNFKEHTKDNNKLVFLIELSRISCFENISITTLKSNNDGSWLAFASSINTGIGVWEWQSESYISYEVNSFQSATCITAMPVGTNFNNNLDSSSFHNTIIATGFNDGVVAIWDINGGYVIHKFSDHINKVTSVQFTLQRNILVSGSIDGQIKFYDILRHRCFKTITLPFNEYNAPTPVLGITVDVTGELLIAYGDQSNSKLFLYEIQTGTLLDTFAFNYGLITSCCFNLDINSTGTIGMCDNIGNAYIWDIYGRSIKGGKPVVLVGAKKAAVCLCFNPENRNELAVSYIGGQISIWNIEEETVKITIDVLREIFVGRELGQVVTALNTPVSGAEYGNNEKYRNIADPNLSIDYMVYTNDGKYLILGNRRSPKILIYSAQFGNIVDTFYITKNKSIDGIRRLLNSRNVVKDIPIHSIDLSDDELLEVEKYEIIKNDKNNIPGTSNTKYNYIKNRKVFKLTGITISSNSSYLLLCTNKGINIYKQSNNIITAYNEYKINTIFTANANTIDNLTMKSTKEEWLKCNKQNDYINAIKIAIAIGQQDLITRSYLSIKLNLINLVLNNLNNYEVVTLTFFINDCLLKKNTEVSGNLSLHFTWLDKLFQHYLKNYSTNTAYLPKTAYISLFESLQSIKSLFRDIYEENYAIESFLVDQITSKINEQ